MDKAKIDRINYLARQSRSVSYNRGEGGTA